MERVIEAAEKHTNFTATFRLDGNGTIAGIFVSASTSGVLTVADGDGAIVTALAAVAGSYYKLPTKFKGDLTVTVVSGTINATLFHSS